MYFFFCSVNRMVISHIPCLGGESTERMLDCTMISRGSAGARLGRYANISELEYSKFCLSFV
jgi:hypothetical protein